MRFRTNRPYYFSYYSEEHKSFFFGVVYRYRKVQAWDDNGRCMFRGWFYYVSSNGQLSYSVLPKSKRIVYKNYFVASKKSMKDHNWLKYKEFEKLLVLFGPPENKKMAPEAGEENPTTEANKSYVL